MAEKKKETQVVAELQLHPETLPPHSDEVFPERRSHLNFGTHGGPIPLAPAEVPGEGSSNSET